MVEDFFQLSPSYVSYYAISVLPTNLGFGYTQDLPHPHCNT